ncbi:MAG: PEGA domain-containing protein [Deltaproteobacteria bacterium]|nr:PEGA domain-containing protein [Deltaproteobacteria bacterium]
MAHPILGGLWPLMIVFAALGALGAGGAGAPIGVDDLLGVFTTSGDSPAGFVAGYIEFSPDHSWVCVTHTDVDRDRVADQVKVRRGTFRIGAQPSGTVVRMTTDDGAALASPESPAFRDRRVMGFRWEGRAYARKAFDQPYFNYAEDEKPKAQAIAVRSDPPGGTVFFNGAAQSDRTPMTIETPIAGVDHEVRVEMPGFMPGVRTVNAKPGERVEVEIDLREGLAELWVRSRPRMRVEIDGGLRGDTPLKLNDLTLGEHRVRLSLAASGLEHEETVVLKRGEITKISRNFMGRLSIDVGIAADVMDADGKRVGVAPLVEKSLPVGRHLLTLRAPDGRETRVSVDIRLNELTTFTQPFDALP